MKKQVILRKGEEHRLLSGHLWAFSNEIKTVEGKPESGDVVELLRHDNKFLGIGFFHPNSLIAFRLLSREKEEISFEFFERRIGEALRLRRSIFPHAETFRLVHGEGDFLPGLIIDKYNEYLSVQAVSHGMNRRLTLLCDVLESMFHPKAIVERNESPLRLLEKLEQNKGVLRGTLDQPIVTEHGIKFKVDLLGGQKTGLFLDQRENRKAVRRYVRSASVLDCFCNEGGFSLNASSGGAVSVEACDISEAAVTRARVNATINQTENVTFIAGDTFDVLKKKAEEGKRYDVVILDPPSFTRSRKQVATATRGYKEINAGAMRLLNPGGFLVSASCSHHIPEDSFFAIIEASAKNAQRRIRIVESAGAGPDHPVLPSMPETSYLKFVIASVH